MTKLLRLRRHTEELVHPPEPAFAPAATGWAARLQRIGSALDITGIDLNHTAIVMDGDHARHWAFVSAAGWRSSLYHQRWATLAMRVHHGIAYDLRANAEPILSDALTRDMQTVITPKLSLRYRAVGSLLDGHISLLLAPNIIEMGGGVVVNALEPDPERAGALRLTSLEFTDQQINDVIRAIGPVAPAPADELLRQA